MRRVLIIDDDRLSGVPPGTVLAKSSTEAINRFKERSAWDDVYFDHDLGGSDTSMRVVEWLEQRLNEEHPIFIERAYVHSMNPAGAEALMRALRRMYPTRRIPLPWERSAR